MDMKTIYGRGNTQCRDGPVRLAKEAAGEGLNSGIV